MNIPKTNLRVLRPTREPQYPGDVFAMQVREQFLFGRVVSSDPSGEFARLPGAILIYVYDGTSSSMEPPARLSPQRLLIPPTFTNRQAWTRGYFLTVENRPLRPEDKVPHHCFYRWDGVYVDELGDKVAARTEPCGVMGVTSYRTLDDLISDALGVPRVPLQPGDEKPRA